jgi:hypothetical protein
MPSRQAMMAGEIRSRNPTNARLIPMDFPLATCRPAIRVVAIMALLAPKAKVFIAMVDEIVIHMRHSADDPDHLELVRANDWHPTKILDSQRSDLFTRGKPRQGHELPIAQSHADGAIDHATPLAKIMSPETNPSPDLKPFPGADATPGI